MNIVDFKLSRMEADYAATIAAGERASQHEDVLPESDDDIEYLRIDTPAVDKMIIPVGFSARPESSPLTTEQVTQIKQHMSTIKLKYQPNWAKSVSDDQLRRILEQRVGSQ